ncbi:MAG TPA: hypothetical protein VGJ20_40370 [Xanthobacteraceae bacterium]
MLAQDGEGRHSTLEWDFVLLNQIQVGVEAADVDVESYYTCFAA